MFVSRSVRLEGFLGVFVIGVSHVEEIHEDDHKDDADCEDIFEFEE